MLIVYLFDGV